MLDEHDWSKILLMNHEPWISFSHGTRKVIKGIDRLSQPNHHVLAQRVKEITADIDSGKDIPKIILLTDSRQSKLVLLEGHVRAITYAAMQHFTTVAMLGTSENVSTWTWW